MFECRGKSDPSHTSDSDSLASEKGSQEILGRKLERSRLMGTFLYVLPGQELPAPLSRGLSSRFLYKAREVSGPAVSKRKGNFFYAPVGLPEQRAC